MGGLGVAGTLADPKLAVFSGATELFANDNWQDNPDWPRTADVAAQFGAFALSPGSKDAAFVVTLQPGSYTVQASGADGGTGTALVEIYEVP